MNGQSPIVTSSTPPWWANYLATYGVSTFLVLYLLGLIPGVESPITKLAYDAEHRQTVLMDQHTAVTAQLATLAADLAAKNVTLIQQQNELIRLERLICRNLLAFKSREWQLCGEPGRPREENIERW